MTIEKDTTLEAGTEVLVKHGIRRTSMNDIADAAGVSRQTLYSRFESKEGIVRAIIVYVTEQTIAKIEDNWQSGASLQAKLDFYFEQAIVAPFLIMQSMPDSADLFSAEHPLVVEAAQQSEKKYTQLIRSLFQPLNKELQKHEETAASIASFIVSTGYGMKLNATSVNDLRKKLATLQRMVRLLVADK